MAKEYVLDKKEKFALAYGTHSVRSKLVRYETLAVGSDLQVTLQQALGEAPWHSVVKLGYGTEAIQEISSANYRFFGAPGAPSDFFPQDVPHPDATYIDVRFPVGIATDNDPDKLIGIYKCLLVADYDANGNQIGFGFSANPARVAMDLIKRLRPRLITMNLIDWASWVEWRDWCAFLINATVDGQTVQIPRFEANVIFMPPFNLAQMLDRLCQICCTDWQWRSINGKAKLRFMAPIDRPPVFTFDLNEVSIESNDFKWLPVDTKQRPNGVVVYWRDYDHPYLKEGDPFLVKRPALIAQDGGVENFLEINVGVARKSQVERTAHYWAKMRCDLADYASFTGSFKSYPALPGDPILFTHDIPGFTNKKFLVVEKEENEDAGEGYPYKLQNFPTNPYSDTDHTPLVTSEPPDYPNPFIAPPPAQITLAGSPLTRADGTVSISVLGHVQFGDFGYKQSCRIIWIKPDNTSEELTELTPNADNQAQFRVSDLAQGIHTFRPVTINPLGPQHNGIGEEDTIVINGSTWTINGHSPIAANGTYRGPDTTIVPPARITAKIVRGLVANNGMHVDVTINGEVLGAKVEQAAQGDSIIQAKVKSFNQFGEPVMEFEPEGFTGPGGAIADGTLLRKYNDSLDGQGFFEILIRNWWGWSAPKYLRGSTLSNTSPVPTPILDKSPYPLDMTLTPLTSSAVRVSATYSFPGGATLKLQRRKVGETTWTDHQGSTAITSLPHDAQNLPEYSELELRLVASTNTAHISNYERVRTYQQGGNAPDYPAPTSLDGAPDSSTPTTKLNFTYISKGNVPTKLFVDDVEHATLSPLAAVAVNATGSFSLTGLNPWQTVKVGLRHDYGSGNLSALVEITRQTQNNPPSGYAPEFSYAYFYETNQFQGEVELQYNHGSGSGGYSIYVSSQGPEDGFNWIASKLYTDPRVYFHQVSRNPQGYYLWYKIEQDDTGLASFPVEVWIPPRELWW